MEWLDVAVAAVLAGFGLFLAVLLALGGGTAIEVALVLILFGAGTLWWSYTSSAWDKLRRK